MPKLHLVGITPDHKGLVLSEHARSKRGDLVLEIDERLLDAIDKAHRLRLKAEGRALESAALPSRREQAPDDGTPGASRLTPREIQQRLRSGETVTAIARSSGVDEGWIERFAPPVFAEQARIIEKARAATFNKPRVGPSGTSLGPAVAANVIEKGVALTLPEIEDAWGAFMRPTGGWCVTFAFSARGRRQLAEWDIDPATGEVTAHNKLAAELAYREPGKRLPQPRPAAAPSAPSSAPSKAGKSLVTRAPGKKAAAPPSTGSAPPASGASPAAGLQTLPGTAPDSGETAPMAVPPGAGPVTMPQRPGPSPVAKNSARAAQAAAGADPGEAPKVPAAGKAPAKKAPARKAPAEKAAPRSTGSTKAPAVKKAPPAKKAPAAKKPPAANKAPAAQKPPAAEKAAPPERPPDAPASPGSPVGPAALDVSPAPDPTAAPPPSPPGAGPVPAPDDIAGDAQRPGGSAMTSEPAPAPAPSEPASPPVGGEGPAPADSDPTGPVSLSNRPGPDSRRVPPAAPPPGTPDPRP